ncbi:hypothetical protein GCM10017600_66490 [Streptosporangium carneum]|uniref:Peptidoglycan-binding protein n=1 Tax=Streptosporangium carneum TaxID=47481 RepID=A0A9W6I8N1_9ACTN|nr:hypothetical protein GCM10017600_66490 [Streptosporangium carneum]
MVVAGALVVAGVGWGVGGRLRSPADEAALRRPPEPSLVTAPVERRKLVSTVVVSGTLEYGSPLPITLAGVVGGDDGAQRATRAPRPGRVTEGGVLMEVNGRPVFTFTGRVPMHRTLSPGAKGEDVKQLQKALRVSRTGVFDRATIAAVTAFYAKHGYEAQQPALTARQELDSLRRAVQTAQETLLTEQKALDQGRDVLPLRLKLRNAEQDLKVAERELRAAESQEGTLEDEARLEAAEAAVRAAEEKLLEAEQALAEARRARNSPKPTPKPTPTPSATSEPQPPPQPEPEPEPQPTVDTELLELRVVNARAELDSARRAMDRAREEAGRARGKRLTELRKAVRDAREAVTVAEQALRQARQLSPVKLRVANARRDLAAARTLLAEYSRTFGTTVPPGEVVFLPRLPARLRKAGVKAGEVVDKAVATVTSSTFVLSGSVDAAEAKLLKRGMAAVIETESGETISATLTALGGGAKNGAISSESVLITPVSMKGLKGLSGATVTARVTVGSTDEEVLVVPVAAVITAADGRPRVQVEVSTDRTREVEVRTGLTADGSVQVSGDLKEGDRVVTGNA